MKAGALELCRLGKEAHRSLGVERVRKRSEGNWREEAEEMERRRRGDLGRVRAAYVLVPLQRRTAPPVGRRMISFPGLKLEFRRMSSVLMLL